MYHKIHPDSPTIWWVYVDEFYRQMSELASKEVVYLDDYDSLNPNHVVITFDGIYKNVLEFAMPILKHFNYPFELFLTSNYIDSKNEFDSVEPKAEFTSKEELSALVANGGRLQWHTRSHINLKNEIDLEVIKNELTVPEELFSLDKDGFNWFAYPHGEFNDIVVNEVKKRFKGAVSCNQGNNTNKYIFNRITVQNNTIFRINRIGCIIASYNYGSYLIEAVESVLKQTIKPNVILISDDCSDDETQIIAEEYVNRYPDLIKYNRNKTNLGVVDHFNKAIGLINADYIFFLGADNRVLSNYIEKCASILDSDEKCAVAYTDYALFGARAKITYDSFFSGLKGSVIEDTFYQINFPEFDNRKLTQEYLNIRNFIHGSSMFKRVAFDSVGGYIKTEKPEDYNLFKRIFEKGWDVKKAKNTNLEYRQHSLGQVNTVLSIQNRMLFYKNAYQNLSKEKNLFESSKLYKISKRLFKIKLYLSKDFKNPKSVFNRIKKYITKKFKKT
jgi:glycosyltransferase involved in cell wall biosynthesis